MKTFKLALIIAASVSALAIAACGDKDADDSGNACSADDSGM